MNSIQAKGISKIASESLNAHSSISIHSVFENSMNIMNGTQLIYVGTRPLPFGLQIECFEDIKNAKSVYCDHNQLNFVLKDRIKKIDLNTLKPIDTEHKGILLKPKEKLSILKKNVTLHEPRPLDYYLGRGQGLTPSGDDFLVGLYSVSFCDQSKPEMMAPLSCTQFEGMTTSVSVAYLNAARQGHFNPDLINLLSCDLSDFEPLFNKILDFGHSSGMDTLEGVVLGLHLMQKITIY